MTKELIVFVVLPITIGSSIWLGWLLNEWQRRPRYRRKHR